MKCPVCVKEMENQELFGVEINYCKLCAGIWLDRGELAIYIERGNIPIKILSLYSVDESQKKVAEGERICPRCNNLLQVLNHRGEKVEYCYRCQGIWFDKGVLKNMMMGYYSEIKEKERKIKAERMQSLIHNNSSLKNKDEQGDTKEKINEDYFIGVDIEEKLLGSNTKEDLVKALPKQLTKKESVNYSLGIKSEETTFVSPFGNIYRKPNPHQSNINNFM